MAGIAAAAISFGMQGGLLAGGSIAGLAIPSLWQAGLASTFGTAALIAIAGMALIVAGLLSASIIGGSVAFSGAVTALIGYAFAGHVVTAGPRWLTVPALLAHMSAVAFWIGSLLPLHAALAGRDAVPIVRRFSAIAAFAVGILIVAGLIIATLQVRDLAALVTTLYGRVLMAKLALVAGALALAAANKWRLTPRLARKDSSAPIALRRTIAAEIVIALAILVVTAVLGTTPPPRALVSNHSPLPDYHSADQHHEHGLSLELLSASQRATLRFSSAHAGANDVEIAISDEDGSAVDAKEVMISAANAAAGVEPIRRAAVRVRPGTWEAKNLLLVPSGTWSIRVEALASDFEKPVFEGAVELR
jgi:copper transport protein